jgi:hypothetical protein
MAVKRIEALADGIAFLNKTHDPSSDAYQLRNPGLTRAYSYKHLGDVDSRGRRIFTSIVGGYRFLIQDLTWKCEGNTRAKGYSGRLRSSDTLCDLLKSYNLDITTQTSCNIMELVDFLNRALPGVEIDSQTPLSFFLEDKENV